MKSILIIIEEVGAYNYIEPVIEKLLSHEVHIYLYINHKLKISTTSTFKLRKVFKFLLFHEINELNLNKFSCLVVSATGKKIENEIVTKAIKFNVRSIQFVDNIYGWKRRLSYKKKTVFPKYLAVINNQCKILAQKEGIPCKIIKVVGHPAWEKIHSNFARKNTNTLFIGSPINEIYKNKLGYTEKEVWDMCIKIHKHYPNLIKNIKYLLHPMQKNPPYISNNYLIKRITKNNKFYGQVIGIYSSLLTEAYLQGKKVISIQPKNKEDNWILSRLYNEHYIHSYKNLITGLTKKTQNSKKLFYEMKNSKIRLYNLINDSV